MSMPSPTGQNWPAAVRLLELRQQARVIANFAEHLAEEVRSHPERAREARSALAEWCKADLQLLARERSDVLRHRRDGPPKTMENNRYAIQLRDLAEDAS